MKLIKTKTIMVLLCCLLLFTAVFPAGCTTHRDRDARQNVSQTGVKTGVFAKPGTMTAAVGTGDGSGGAPLAFIATDLLTQPTNRSVTVSMVPGEDLTVSVEYGQSPGEYPQKTSAVNVRAGVPFTVTLNGLASDTEYYYRTLYKAAGESTTSEGPEHSFHTMRSPGNSFTFGVQTDSHPERTGTMFDSDLYGQTLRNVAEEHPDFYISLGDDFSIDPLIEKNQASQQNVDQVYLKQRTYLGSVGCSSPVFLVNGNHEEAAMYLLDGTPDNAAVYAGKARQKYFPQPVPDWFYTGDNQAIPYVGLPGDYYAWDWGDALFVVIDPYWHSPIAVDRAKGTKETKKKENRWEITLGDAQYQWLKNTLETSNARYKFVFTHHILGTGRGGVEEAGLYEWGGTNPRGVYQFSTYRPGWELPIQQLMTKYGVTIFFQGHDHLYARQELEGVVYQEVPCPADPTYHAFNAEAYMSGINLPNSGYLRVNVSPERVTVDYVNTFLPVKETETTKNGMVALSYTIPGTHS